METGGRCTPKDETSITIHHNKMKDHINSTDNEDALSLPPLVQPNCGYTHSNKSSRKCSYCRKSIQHSSIQFCGGCQKRAYCSEECESSDWSITGTGQRHINWCTRYECGEEDVDWEVVPIPNKGLGIIAKRFLPARYRIMADPVYTDPNDHPGILDLAPEGASLETKFVTNSVQGDEFRDGGKSYVGLRFSRANHDCHPNANYVYDEVARVVILFAQRDISPGEEICICYATFANLDLDRKTAHLNADEEFKSVQECLKEAWGITCPDDCYCKDSDAKNLVLEGRRIHTEMSILVGRGRTEESLEFGENLIDIFKRLDVSMARRMETVYHCFQIGLMREETLERAKGYLRNVNEFYKEICPYSEFTKSVEKLLNHPETDHNYLSMNKKPKM